MEDLIDLTKEAEICLDKIDAPKIIARVCAVTDVSGSTRNMFKSGKMQNMIDRFFAIGYMFDDNQTLDSFIFDTKAKMITPVVESMFGTYLKQHGPNPDQSAGPWWQGTNYSPALSLVNDFYFGAGVPGETKPAVYEDTPVTVKGEEPGFFGKLFGKKSAEGVKIERRLKTPASTGMVKSDGDDPVYALFLTDGESTDESETERWIQRLANQQIYIKFIGITDRQMPQFTFLKRMAVKYGHVGFIDAGHIDQLSTAALYADMLDEEFINWYKKVKGL